MERGAGKNGAGKNDDAREGTARGRARSRSSAADACLDPRLALAARRAKREGPAPLGAAPAQAGVVAPRSLAGVPLGLRSLATRGSRFAARRILDDDAVPVLVHAEERDGDRVRAAVAELAGEARRLSATTLAAHVPRAALRALAGHAGVRFVEANARLAPCLDEAHRAANLRVDGGWTVEQTGDGVLIGVVDTGIDTTHSSFGVGAGTRIVDYLDQETGAHHDEAALKAGAGAASPDTDGHGTHVAGIAAGDGAGSPQSRYQGVAPNAELAVVKTTFDTVEIAAGVAHVLDVAAARGKPCVVNLSLGGHFGGHDGSSVLERTIDELSGVGRIVVVSAGNEGRANIHAGHEFGKGDGDWTAHFQLLPFVWEGSFLGELELQVWTPWESDLSVRLRSPNGQLFEAPEEGSREVDRGQFFVQATHRRAVYSGDDATTFYVAAVPETQWLRGWSLLVTPSTRPEAARGAVHAWILDAETGAFTSGFTKSHLVGMPGTAFSAITVASFASRERWKSLDPAEPTVLDAMNVGDISYFSSPGPTRDGHNKPEVCAPGQYLVAPLSAAADEDAVPLWQRVAGGGYAAMQGTSMAAPYVTGALALLLEKAPDLDWAEAKRRILKSARHDAFSTPAWSPRWGYGKLDVERLLTVEPG